MADYYKILQVDPSAEEDIIRAAYQRLIRKYHPDRNPSADAEAQTQVINEAYQVLSNSSRRIAYDKTRVPGSPAHSDVRREEDLRKQERHRREQAEEALRHAQDALDVVKRQTQEEIHGLHFKVREERHRRHEVEAKLAALEKAEALRKGFRLGSFHWNRKALMVWVLAGFGGAGAVVAVSSFLLKSMPQEVSTQALEPETVFVKAGCFEMGSAENESERNRYESPKHQVCLDSFHLGKHEVTFDEYDRYARATHRPLPDDNGWGRNRRPVINISWNEANAYAEWLGKQTGKHYRLPSESEWEYAARAGENDIFSTGNCITTSQANYDGRADYFYCGAKTLVFLAGTQPVGSYPANIWGLQDMQGNVSEWTADCWHDNYIGAPNHGTAWREATDCNGRVVRGGSWSDDPARLRSAYRGRWLESYRYSDLGFRLARD